MNQLIIKIATIILMSTGFTMAANGQLGQRYFSANGDTLYVGDKIILRNTNHTGNITSHNPPTLTKTNTIFWESDVRLTHMHEHRYMLTDFCHPFFNDNPAVLYIARYDSIGAFYENFKVQGYNYGDFWDSSAIFNFDSSYTVIKSIASVNSFLYANTNIGRSSRNTIFYRSSDNGISWNGAHQFESEPQPYIGFGSIIADSNNVYFTYTLPMRNYVGRVDSIMFSTSSDYGQGWSPIRGIVSHTNDFYFSWLKKSENRLHLVYQEYGSLVLEIMYAYSDDNGLTWSIPEMLSEDDSCDSQWPYLSVDNAGNLCVTWFDYKYPGPSGFTGDILMRISRDNGENWSSEQRITYDSLGTISRTVIHGDNIFVIRTKGFLHTDIYYLESRDGGFSWSTEIPLVQLDSSNSDEPELLYNNSCLYLFWADDRDNEWTDYEIYFKRGCDYQGISNDDMNYEPFTVYAYPQPFNNQVILGIRGMIEEPLDIRIYNILGRQIKTLSRIEPTSTDSYRTWDGTDNVGNDVGSGIYFARLNGIIKSKSLKITLIK